jgi:prepilin-type N-terminal cleavage/methylation domain-containing protein
MKAIHLHREPSLCQTEPFTLFRTGSAKKGTKCRPEPRRRMSTFFVVPPFARLLGMTWKRAVPGLTLTGDRGLTIIEVLAAIAILSFGILAVATMQASSIKGNSQAIGITEGITVAQGQVEQLLRLPYNNASLADTDNDGTDTSPDPDYGFNDNGGDYGLNDTGADADFNPPNVGRYQIYYNVAVDVPIGKVKTVRVIVLWTDRGVQKSASVDFMKSDII